MTVGLPGVGIGGIFYLASALLMPMRSCTALLAGRETRGAVALGQATIAGLTLTAIWATGWAIGWLIAVVSPASLMGSLSPAAVGVPVHNAVRMAAILGSFGTLTLVLMGVQVVRLVLPRRPTPRSSPLTGIGRSQSAA